MSRILIGYGGGDSANDALALGLLFARATKAHLVLTCVYSDQPVMSEDYRLARQREAEQKLDVALAGLASSGLASHAVAHPARSVAHGLGELALSERPELVVIGSRHTAPLGNLLSGAVTERLFGTSPCPVAIAPRGLADRAPDAFRRIGTGYDGSAEARAALAEALRLAQATAAELRVLVICDSSAPAGLDERLATARRDEADARLEEALATLAAGQRATGEVVTGDPAPALAAAAVADALDLLVIGSRGFGPFHAALGGSVSSELARHPSCPLVVVPHRAMSASSDSEAEPSTSLGVADG